MAKTEEGKAISARNATTHGLFCRQTVLPHLGESAEAYQRLFDALCVELRPRNLMERQYLELWAEASWKLRRLSRWEAQLWENETLDEDARLTKLERVGRLQSRLRRQLDKSVALLDKDVHDLYARRTREDVLDKMHLTETGLRCNDFRAQEVEHQINANLRWRTLTDGFDPQTLDNTGGALDNAGESTEDATPAQDCQGEHPSATVKNDQNEPAPELPPCDELPPLTKGRAGVGSLPKAGEEVPMPGGQAEEASSDAAPTATDAYLRRRTRAALRDFARACRLPAECNN